ncbi:copper amine oxidase-like protein [Ruminiclostridium sufflavum DSM 19573]|uniref:Copper amine oxidase-like protein n=1 Tax=Ruminiclostridium sufflavum DSM 19573 TaxID=1121337 RepID=A0A318XP91_9FIRM|nr:copper amine oxidase N-terminal domain-containing protein [Ruminiclostridium sufflavum]PYG87448.1 copper amine oxidase-like protein [Ruminiclostridium sufflavum DSM 19573]
MNKIKAIICIIAAVAVFTACFSNTYAADYEKMNIELKIGSGTGKINGNTSKVEKPYIENKTVMVPLSWVVVAIGAEINRKAGSKIEIIYGELNAELTISSKTYIANSESRKLTAAPVIKNGSTMVPLEFIKENFPVSVTEDTKKGDIKIILEDDGALTDLSFLTGGISSKKIGNSYYGWSLSIPSGSRMVSNNYKSNNIGIMNESRNLYLYVSVEYKKDMDLEALFDSVDMYESNIRESKLDLKADIPYFQYTALSSYNEASRVKVFEKGEFFYFIEITSDDEFITPEKLMTDKYYDNIVNSFDLSYKGNEKGIEDISKVKDGRAGFYNYISLSSTSKYLVWSMDIPVEWEDSSSFVDPMSTSFSLDNRHYMKVTAKTIDEGADLSQYADEIKKHYDKYFNPKIYSYIGSDSMTIAGLEAQNLKFSLKYGDNVYHVDELYFIKDGFVYEISIYLSEKDYETTIKDFIDTVDKMSFYTVNKQKYQKDMELFESKYSGIRVSQQDDIFKYVNKQYSWSANIPGYWQKYSYYDDSEISFVNEDTAAAVTISAVEKDSYYEADSIEEALGMDIIEMIYEVKPAISITNERGLQVKNYTYRIEDPEDNIYTTIIFKVLEKGDYTYCFKSQMYDLNATDSAVAEVNDIWKSFEMTD